MPLYKFCLLFKAYVTLVYKNKIMIKEDTLYNFTTYHVVDKKVRIELHKFMPLRKFFPTSRSCPTQLFEHLTLEGEIEEKDDDEDEDWKNGTTHVWFFFFGFPF